MSLLKKIIITISLTLIYSVGSSLINNNNIIFIGSIYADCTTACAEGQICNAEDVCVAEDTPSEDPNSDPDSSTGGGAPTLVDDPVQTGLTEFLGLNPGIRTEGTLIGFVAQIIRWGLGLIGTVFFVLVLISGFNYMTAGGDSNKAKQSLSGISNAVIGLILIMGSYLIVNYILSAVLAV